MSESLTTECHHFAADRMGKASLSNPGLECPLSQPPSTQPRAEQWTPGSLGAPGRRGQLVTSPPPAPPTSHLTTQLGKDILTLDSKEASALFMSHILLLPNWGSRNVLRGEQKTLQNRLNERLTD